MSRIHLLTRDNGAGLSRDLEVLRTTLRELGHTTAITHLNRRVLPRVLGLRLRALWQGWREGRSARRFDINLMIERVKLQYAGLARRNVLIPNPEWFAAEQISALPAFDRVFVKTLHAQAIFSALGCATTYIGFSGADRLRMEVPRSARFLHIAGRSANKGTQTLLNVWARHSHWPLLTVIWHARHPGVLPQAPNIHYRREYVDDDELCGLQNSHRFHLCPSETEGYGHYLAEALGVGAIVITLDAPPMNELVDADRGLLIPAAPTGTQGLATTYGYGEADLTAAVETAISLSAAEQARMSNAARAWFETNAREFPQRLRSALAALD